MRALIWFPTLLIFICLALPLQADEYLIQPGDNLGITVLGEPDLTRNVVVNQQGRITLPLLKGIGVANLSLEQASEKIAISLEERFIKNPQVIVELIELAKIRVTVSGEVRNPGVYPVLRGARLMEAITSAGGYTANADLSGVGISHADGSSAVETLDLSAFLLGGDASVNIKLSDGDTIIVPSKVGVTLGTVSVLGAVGRPGQYALTQGMTVREVIMLASGPTELADLDNITLRHGDSVEAIRINYSAAAQGDVEANPSLKPGDVIFVGAKEQLGYYTIHGAVNSPGRYELRGKTNITEAIAIAGGVKDRAKLGEVHILRTSDGASTTLKINVGDIMAGRSENVVLHDQDNVYVPQGKRKTDVLRWASLAISLMWLLSRN